MKCCKKIKKWLSDKFTLILGLFTFLLFLTKFKKVKKTFTDLSKIEVKTSVKKVTPKHKKTTDI